LDQDAFRDTYNAVNERRCPYEKAILTGNCGCSLAKRFCIAEREGVRCAADDGQTRCMDLLEPARPGALRAQDHRRHARPAARQGHARAGGRAARRARAALADDAAAEPQAPIDDVDALLSQAAEHFGGLAELPYQRIVQQIAAYRGRPSFRERRRARKRRDDDEPA
jgi:predicted lipid-binding transport protein (Tim44 family)